MKQDIVTQFQLPKYIRGKSFAEASKLIERKFKDREDKISIDTKESLLERLAKAQEYIKQSQPSTSSNTFGLGGPVEADTTDPTKGFSLDGLDIGDATDVISQIGGIGKDLFGKSQIDTSGNTNIMADNVHTASGAISKGLSGFKTGFKVAGPIGGAVLGGLSVGASLIAGGKDKRAAKLAQANGEYRANNKFGSDFAEGGAMPGGPKCGGPGQPPCEQAKLDSLDLEQIKNNIGFDKETANRMLYKDAQSAQDTTKLDFGKYGPVNYFNSTRGANGSYDINNTQKNPNNRATMPALIKYLQERNQGKKINFNFKSRGEFKDGGTMYGNGGGLRPKVNTLLGKIGDGVNRDIDTNKLDTMSGLNKVDLGNSINRVPSSEIKNPQFKNKKDLSQLLRFAPIAANAGQLLGQRKPRQEALSRLDNRYKPNFIDEMGVQNTINNQYGNINEAISNSSNGSVGAARSNMLGAYLNKSKALSNANLKIQTINNAEKSKAQQFNLNVDSVNLKQSNAELDINDKNKGAYDTNRSGLIAQLGENIGKIGKENFYKKQAKELFGYDFNGKYFTDQDGNKVSKPDVFKKILDKLKLK